MKIIPLGAGQDVGRSCILVSLGGKNIMFDCGMHMGYQDERRFPDFSYISSTGRFDQILDCVIISHFHLDHCGALPYFTEICGYTGPIYMTYPSKAIVPVLLEDYRKITVEKRADQNFFTANQIKACMKRVIPVNLQQTIKVDDELTIRAYYAGHVLGAAMFYASAGGESVVYTGDYNMTPDRHLGAAFIEKLRPDLLITESTYAATIRDSKRCRERDFLKRIHKCVERGGKVLIPVFALGRAQELCILLDTYWERMGLGHVPIYFSAGLTEKANLYYKLFINWTNQKIKHTFLKRNRNMFDFKHVKPFDRSTVDSPGPMVLFATPGMLHAGTSLEVFKKWAGNEKNMVILPGYCVVGTVGNKLMAGQSPCRVEIDKKTSIDVKCKVKSLSFSAHADAKGIFQLIRMAQPKNVMLVHGEKSKMEFLKEKIVNEFMINCYNPANGHQVTISTTYHSIPVDVSLPLFGAKETVPASSLDPLERAMAVASAPGQQRPIVGQLVIDKDSTENNWKIMDSSEASRELLLPEHLLSFRSERSLPKYGSDKSDLLAYLQNELLKGYPEAREASIAVDPIEGKLVLKSFEIVLLESIAKMSWSFEDEEIALLTFGALERITPKLEDVQQNLIESEQSQ